jgi:hypothetical protein
MFLRRARQDSIHEALKRHRQGVSCVQPAMVLPWRMPPGRVQVFPPGGPNMLILVSGMPRLPGDKIAGFLRGVRRQELRSLLSVAKPRVSRCFLRMGPTPSSFFRQRFGAGRACHNDGRGTKGPASRPFTRTLNQGDLALVSSSKNQKSGPLGCWRKEVKDSD